MKKQKNAIEPTRSELAILQVLWQYGPSTVRFVNDKLNEKEKEVHYTSTLKLMQIMAEKGIVSRDQSQMKHIYAPAGDEHEVKGALLDKFINNMFNGSPSSLMMQLLGNKKVSEKELDAIRELIQKHNK